MNATHHIHRTHLLPLLRPWWMWGTEISWGFCSNVLLVFLKFQAIGKIITVARMGIIHKFRGEYIKSSKLPPNIHILRKSHTKIWVKQLFWRSYTGNMDSQKLNQGEFNMNPNHLWVWAKSFPKRTENMCPHSSLGMLSSWVPLVSSLNLSYIKFLLVPPSPAYNSAIHPTRHELRQSHPIQVSPKTNQSSYLWQFYDVVLAGKNIYRYMRVYLDI